MMEEEKALQIKTFRFAQTDSKPIRTSLGTNVGSYITLVHISERSFMYDGNMIRA